MSELLRHFYVNLVLEFRMWFWVYYIKGKNINNSSTIFENRFLGTAKCFHRCFLKLCYKWTIEQSQCFLRNPIDQIFNTNKKRKSQLIWITNGKILGIVCVKADFSKGGKRVSKKRYCKNLFVETKQKLMFKVKSLLFLLLMLYLNLPAKLWSKSIKTCFSNINVWTYEKSISHAFY